MRNFKPAAKAATALRSSTKAAIYFYLLLGAMVVSLFGGLVKANADPAWIGSENWKTDFSKRIIKVGEVLSGGPPRDGIPPIDDPRFVSIQEATHLRDMEPVISFEHNGDARAYPLQVLMWHEIANDIVGGHPFAITYCPLCNAAIVFDAYIDGKRHDFGTTGRLRKSDLLMYDRQTESWWQQFSGEAVIGQYAGEKILKIMPSRLESWDSFKERFKKAKILVPNNPHMRNYGRNPYVNYDSRNAPYPLFTGELPNDINPMARVVVLRRNGKAVSILSYEKVRTELSLEVEGFLLTWNEGRASALSSSTIAQGRDVGNLVVTELVDGKKVDAVHDITFAFVANAFHPEMKIVQ